MTNALVLTAAGSSARMGSSVKKEYLTISDGSEGTVSVLTSALFSFLSTHLFTFIIITVPANGETDTRLVLDADFRIAPLIKKDSVSISFAEGGSTRQESVKKGLDALKLLAKTQVPEKVPEIVLIHDGARPWVTPEVINAVLEGVRIHSAAVPAVTSVDTQKEIDKTGKIIRHLDRSLIVSVQTPQGFLFGPLCEAHAKAAGDGHTYTDDTEIWDRYAGDVYICRGDRKNRKITFQGDL